MPSRRDSQEVGVCKACVLVLHTDTSFTPMLLLPPLCWLHQPLSSFILLDHFTTICLFSKPSLLQSNLFVILSRISQPRSAITASLFTSNNIRSWQNCVVCTRCISVVYSSVPEVGCRWVWYVPSCACLLCTSSYESRMYRSWVYPSCVYHSCVYTIVVFTKECTIVVCTIVKCTIVARTLVVWTIECTIVGCRHAWSSSQPQVKLRYTHLSLIFPPKDEMMTHCHEAGNKNINDSIQPREAKLIACHGGGSVHFGETSPLPI